MNIAEQIAIIRDELSRADQNAAYATGFILIVLGRLADIIEEMAGVSGCVYCANGDDPFDGAHYFHGASGQVSVKACSSPQNVERAIRRAREEAEQKALAQLRDYSRRANDDIAHLKEQAEKWERRVRELESICADRL